jgi:hypothetical protein
VDKVEKQFDEGVFSKAYIVDKKILLEAKTKDTFNSYKNFLGIIGLLKQKITSVAIPYDSIKLINPCSKYPFGAMTYIMLKGTKLDISKCSSKGKDNIAKKLTLFLAEIHGVEVHKDKKMYIKLENKKINKNIILLKKYFTTKEILHIKKLQGKYNTFLKERVFCTIHGDLYQENILVNKKQELASIIDFGSMTYLVPEYDFACIYKMDKQIFATVLKNYHKKISLEGIKLCLYFKSIKFFEHVKN